MAFTWSPAFKSESANGISSLVMAVSSVTLNGAVLDAASAPSAAYSIMIVEVSASMLAMVPANSIAPSSAASASSAAAVSVASAAASMASASATSIASAATSSVASAAASVAAASASMAAASAASGAAASSVWPLVKVTCNNAKTPTKHKRSFMVL